MIAVHQGDFYDPMVLYRRLMGGLGAGVVTEYEPENYAPAWCTWGYQTNFTMDAMLANAARPSRRNRRVRSAWGSGIRGILDACHDPVAAAHRRRRIPRGEDDLANAQAELLPQLPVNLGRRFSMNAATPSRWSAVPALRRCVKASRSSSDA